MMDYTEKNEELCRALGWVDNGEGDYTDPEGKPKNFLPDYYGNPFWTDHMMQRALILGVRLVLSSCQPGGFVCGAFDPSTKRRLVSHFNESLTEAIATACSLALATDIDVDRKKRRRQDEA